MSRKPTISDTTADTRLRRGWTTGACAAAAARAAFQALVTGRVSNRVRIDLPQDRHPEFALEDIALDGGSARASVVKDAGDDPDVTHGAVIGVCVTRLAPGSGLVFRAGAGVGTVTKPGLPVPPGEPAINPKPREIIEANLRQVLDDPAGPLDLEVTVSIRDGERIARETWNPRLGIVGGLSVLGTTGVVIPYSCSAWIHSIHRGIDVARATGRTHVAAATGKTSEAAVRALYGLPEEAMIDMGDFAGGMLKYLRRHPVDRVTIAGGFAKLAKLAQGNMDLHSSRSQLDLSKLGQMAGVDAPLADRIAGANTGAEALSIAGDAGIDLAWPVARQARAAALAVAGNCGIDVVIVGRQGEILARTDQDHPDPEPPGGTA